VKGYANDFLLQASRSCLHIAYTQLDGVHRLLTVAFLKGAPRTEWNRAAQILGASNLFDSVTVLS
jgi:hypothetical protein